MAKSAYLIASLTNLSVLLFLAMLIAQRLSKNKRVVLAVMLISGFIATLIPCCHQMTLIEIMRGSLGDLSICGLFVFILLETGSLRGISPSYLLPKPLCALLATIGTLLYLATFAYIKMDIYAFGYSPTTLVLCIVFLLEILVWYLSPLFAIIWLIGLVSFYFQLQASVNLWDYLFDPILWLVTIHLLIKNSAHAVMRNVKHQMRRAT